MANRLHLTNDTDWLVGITTVRNFRVIDTAACSSCKGHTSLFVHLEQWLEISYIHVDLNVHHQLVAFYGLDVSTFVVSKII